MYLAHAKDYCTCLNAVEILLELWGAKVEATIFSRLQQELQKKVGIYLEAACGVKNLVNLNSRSLLQDILLVQNPLGLYMSD